MRLSDADAQRFYEAWWQLLDWVNAERHVVADTAKHGPHSPFEISDAIQVRNVLWSDQSLLERFVQKNPARLGSEGLALVESWKHRRVGMFCVLKHYKKHTVFLDDRDREGYAVVGLKSDLADRIPELPRFVDAVLLPFGDRIVIDGILTITNVLLGPGIRGRQAELYRDVVERGALHTSLLPEAVAPDVREKRRNAVNVRVGEAFVASLRKRGMSDKIIARDVAGVERLAAVIAPRTLRKGAGEDLQASLARIERVLNPHSHEILLSWKRFFTFLRDTERIGYDEAQNVLEDLKALAHRPRDPR